MIRWNGKSSRMEKGQIISLPAVANYSIWKGYAPNQIQHFIRAINTAPSLFLEGFFIFTDGRKETFIHQARAVGPKDSKDGQIKNYQTIGQERRKLFWISVWSGQANTERPGNILWCHCCLSRYQIVGPHGWLGNEWSRKSATQSAGASRSQSHRHAEW